MTKHEDKVILSLDAGGTNFVFSAIKNYKEIVSPVKIAAPTDNREECLLAIVNGFYDIINKLDETPVAVSFAFPGPADYKNGVIGDLPNLKAFRGDVALGAYLEKKLNLPVYINNDGNLFAYGEALYGTLPLINKWLEDAGNPKRYKNLLGITLGTGFGAGVVTDNNILLTGDNGCGGDVWIMRNKKYPHLIAEESVSIRAVKRVYKYLSGESSRNLTPKDIFDIAEGNLSGNRDAAVNSFMELGEAVGDILAQTLTLIDGIAVIGGGLTGASKYILPGLMSELRSNTGMLSGESFPRMQMELFNLNDDNDKQMFLKTDTATIKIPDYDEYVSYEKSKKTGVIITPFDTGKSIMYGAYAYALQELKKKNK